MELITRDGKHFISEEDRAILHNLIRDLPDFNRIVIAASKTLYRLQNKLREIDDILKRLGAIKQEEVQNAVKKQ